MDGDTAIELDGAAEEALGLYVNKTQVVWVGKGETHQEGYRPKKESVDCASEGGRVPLALDLIEAHPACLLVYSNERVGKRESLGAQLLGSPNGLNTDGIPFTHYFIGPGVETSFVTPGLESRVKCAPIIFLRLRGK